MIFFILFFGLIFFIFLNLTLLEAEAKVKIIVDVIYLLMLGFCCWLCKDIPF